jgi:hypothetical protein
VSIRQDQGTVSGDVFGVGDKGGGLMRREYCMDVHRQGQPVDERRREGW